MAGSAVKSKINELLFDLFCACGSGSFFVA